MLDSLSHWCGGPSPPRVLTPVPPLWGRLTIEPVVAVDNPQGGLSASEGVAGGRGAPKCADVLGKPGRSLPCSRSPACMQPPAERALVRRPSLAASPQFRQLA